MSNQYYFQAKKYPTMRLFNCIIQTEDDEAYYVKQGMYESRLPKAFWQLEVVTAGLQWASVTSE